MRSLGEEIRYLRKRNNLLIKDLSGLTNIDKALLSKIERNERQATEKQILKICEVLQLNKHETINNLLGERIAYDLKDNDNYNEILKIAEQKIRHLKKA